MIRYIGKSTNQKKTEAKKIKEMNTFAREQFYTLSKKHISISIQLYQL